MRRLYIYLLCSTYIYLGGGENRGGKTDLTGPDCKSDGTCPVDPTPSKRFPGLPGHVSGRARAIWCLWIIVNGYYWAIQFSSPGTSLTPSLYFTHPTRYFVSLVCLFSRAQMDKRKTLDARKRAMHTQYQYLFTEHSQVFLPPTAGRCC